MAAARRRIRVPLSQLTPELRDALRVIGVDVAEGESTHEEIAALVTEIQAERGVVEEEEVNPHPMTATEEDLLILRHRRQAEQALRFGQLYGRTARDLACPFWIFNQQIGQLKRYSVSVYNFHLQG